MRHRASRLRSSLPGARVTPTSREGRIDVRYAGDPSAFAGLAGVLYALGFAMMNDIRRIASDPTAEDREWFPDFAGCGDWMGTLRQSWVDYRDESFILQFLSPKLMRDFRLFAVSDDAKESSMDVAAIHNEAGYRKLRTALARLYDLATHQPDIQVVGANLAGDRTLTLRHTRHRDIPLAQNTKEAVLKHIRRLWGYSVVLEEPEA